jgi:hypothetical protein
METTPVWPTAGHKFPKYFTQYLKLLAVYQHFFYSTITCANLKDVTVGSNALTF